MKRALTKAVSTIAIASLAVSTVALAEPAPDFALSPESIRARILESNLSITQAMNQVQIAKDSVSLASSSLFPSLNVSVLATVANPPLFILSAVQGLLPFLSPANWFNLKAEKHLLEAQKVSYRIIELNTYGEALAAYYAVVADHEVLSVYDQEVQDATEIYDIRVNAANLGTGSIVSAQEARRSLDAVLSVDQQAKEVVNQDVAAMRAMLNLPLSTRIVLRDGAPFQLPASEWEDKPIQDGVAHAMKISPEASQLEAMRLAAKDAKWSQLFGFIDTSTIGAQGFSGGGSPEAASLGNLRAIGGASFGLGTIPLFRLSNDRIHDIELQRDVLEQQTTQVLEASLASAGVVQSELETAKSSERSARYVYEDSVNRYNLGVGSREAALRARMDLEDSSLARISAQLYLNQLRVTLHRMMLSGQFAEIRGCSLSVPEDHRSLFQRLFHRRHLSLDQVCHEASKDNALEHDQPGA